MDLSKELKIMFSDSNEAQNSLIENLVDTQREEQRLAEERIHILMVVKLTESLKKCDFKVLKNFGVDRIRLYTTMPGSNVYRADRLRINFINAENKSIFLEKEQQKLMSPVLNILETKPGVKLYQRYTNKFVNMYINLQDNVEKIEEQILDALLMPHLKEVLKSNKMNMELQDELNVNGTIKPNRTKI